MTRYVFFVACLIWGSVLAQESALSMTNGFLGYRLGYPGDSMPGGMTYLGTSQHLQKNRPASDEATFGDIRFHKVFLYFYQDKLLEINLRTQGSQNSWPLRDYFMAVFGTGTQKDAVGTIFEWVDGDVWLRYVENIVTHDAEISFQSLSMIKAYQTGMDKLIYGK